MSTMKREIAIIDRNVDDLDALRAGIQPDVQPVLLSDAEPAPRQMARAPARELRSATAAVTARSRRPASLTAAA